MDKEEQQSWSGFHKLTNAASSVAKHFLDLSTNSQASSYWRRNTKVINTRTLLETRDETAKDKREKYHSTAAHSPMCLKSLTIYSLFFKQSLTMNSIEI